MKNILLKAILIFTFGAVAATGWGQVYDPIDESTNIAISPTLTITFNPGDELVLGIGTLYITCGAPNTVILDLSVPDERVSVSGNVFTIDLSGTYLYTNSTYSVYSESGDVLWVNGDEFDFSDNTTWNFTTVNPAAPTLVSLSPTDDNITVDVKSNFVITYDRNIRFNTRTSTSYIRIYKAGSPATLIETITCLGGVASYSSGVVSISGNSLTINPNADLNYSTSYYITTTLGALEATDGGRCTALSSTSWNFTTIAPPTPPTLSSTTPSDGSTTADIATDLTMNFGLTNIRFNTTSTPHYINVYQTGNGTPIYTINSVSGIASFTSGTGSVAINGASFTINPSTNFTIGTDYYVTVDNGAIESTTGGIYAGFTDPAYWNFKTATPPSVTTYSPADNATGVAINASLELTFNETVTTTGGTGYLHIFDSGGEKFTIPYSSGSISGSGTTTLTISNIAFLENTAYYVRIDAGFVKSVASGAAYAGISDNTTWNFTTVNNAPVATFTPANNTPAVSIVPEITVAFNKAVRLTSGAAIVNSNVKSLITIKNTDNTDILASTDYDATISSDKKLITIVLRRSLNEEQTYTISVAAVEDNNGVEQSAPSTSSFDTDSYVQWLGTTNDWDTPSNWFPAAVPTSNKSVRIQKTGSNDPVLGSNSTVRRILIAAGNGVRINNGATLTVNNDTRLMSSAASNAYLWVEGTFAPLDASKTRIYQTITTNAYWYMVSSPVVTATPSGVNSNGVFSYWDDTNGVWSAISSSTALVAAQGYQTYGTRSLVFSGAINNNASYDFTAHYNSKNAGWGLAGNPYPCAIDWTACSGIWFSGATPAANDVLNQFHIYLNNTSQYGIYSAGTGTNLDATHPGYIPSNHAFWVRVADIGTYGNSGTLTIPNSARVNVNNSYLKTASVSSDLSIIRLAGSVDKTTDEAVVAFSLDADNTVDNLDAEKRFSPSNTGLLELFTVLNAKQFAINFYNSVSDVTTIPLGYKLQTAGAAKIELTELKNIPSGVEVYLVDNLDPQNPVRTNLSSQKSYSFTSAVGTFNSRFVIELVKPIATDVTNGQLKSILVSSEDHSVYVTLPSLTKPRAEILDMNGRIIYSGELKSLSQNQIPLSVTGIFVVKVMSNEGIYSQKVLIK